MVRNLICSPFFPASGSTGNFQSPVTQGDATHSPSALPPILGSQVLQHKAYGITGGSFCIMIVCMCDFTSLLGQETFLLNTCNTVFERTIPLNEMYSVLSHWVNRLVSFIKWFMI
jgi:hypothetical protein